MRIPILALLLLVSIAGSANAHLVVNLNEPGAMEKFAREHPMQHKILLAEIAAVQTIHVEPLASMRDARMDDRSKGATFILPSDPAVKRITINVGAVEYRYIAQLTKDPARFQRAR